MMRFLQNNCGKAAIRVIGAGLGLAFATLAGPAPARANQDTLLREYDVKAAFLYNFITFTEWPDSAFAAPDSPFVIGVLGLDPFGSSLDRLVAGEQVGKHPIVVKRFRRIDDARGSNLLFIAASEGSRVGPLLRRLQGTKILTVGEVTGFAEQGGAIGFVTAGNVHLEVNAQAVKSAGLNLSSKIMRLARVVEGPPGGAGGAQ